MKFGIAPPNYAKWLDSSVLATMARSADDGAYNSIWFGDHVAFVREDAEKYGTAFLDAFACLSFVAGITSRLRLGANVIVVPYRHPVLQAKMAATIDVLSGGRLELGVGAGHVKRESEALGVDYDVRGPMMDEYLDVMQLMWTQEMFDYHGRWVDVVELCPLTRPLQQPFPIIVGGSNTVSMRRALRLDAAWTPMEGSVENVGRRTRQLADLAEQSGKPMPRVVVRWQIHPIDQSSSTRSPKSSDSEIYRFRMTTPEMHDYIGAMTELGVDELIIDLPPYQGRYLEWMGWMREEFMQAAEPLPAASG